MLGVNVQAASFFFTNLLSFLENAGDALTYLQPWREFPRGHPRHGACSLYHEICQNFNRANPKIIHVVMGFAGEPPPTEEQERKRLSRLRIIRFLASVFIAYSVS